MFTPRAKLTIGLIVVAVFGIYIAGFIHGVHVDVERQRADMAGHNSVLIMGGERGANNR